MLHVYVFLDYFSFSHFLSASFPFFKLKLSSLNFALNFAKSQPHFSRLNVLVCCCTANPSSVIACVFSKILKTVRAVRVNETKITLRNAFLFNAFILRSKKNKKMTKGPSFGTARGVLTCLLNLSFRMPHICVFWTTLVLTIFDHFSLLLEIKTNFIKFCHLNALVCYCAANQCKKIACVSSKSFKISARSKGQVSCFQYL